MGKNYSPELKAKIVMELLKEEKMLSQIESEYGIHHSVITRWKSIVLQNLPKLFTDEGQKQRNTEICYENKIQQLYTQIGKLSTQLEWLKKKSGVFHE